MQCATSLGPAGNSITSDLALLQSVRPLATGTATSHDSSSKKGGETSQNYIHGHGIYIPGCVERRVEGREVFRDGVDKERRCGEGVERGRGGEGLRFLYF